MNGTQWLGTEIGSEQYKEREREMNADTNLSHLIYDCHQLPEFSSDEDHHQFLPVITTTNSPLNIQDLSQTRVRDCHNIRNLFNSIISHLIIKIPQAVKMTAFRQYRYNINKYTGNKGGGSNFNYK